MKQASYISDNLFIVYVNAPFFSENSTTWFTQKMFQSMYPDLSKCYESHEGNLTILESITNNDQYYPMVFLSKGNDYILIVGDNISTIKEMGHSVRFN